MNERGAWQGMWTVVRFNWPLYAAAVAVLAGAGIVLLLVSHTAARAVAALALGGCVWFLAGSLAASHLIYDRSDLYRWRWIERALRGSEARSFIFCHTGFDEASASLRQRLGAEHWRVLDHFDPAQMTEASIRRARALFPPQPGTVAAPFDRWPVEAASADAIVALLAIHELRSEAGRAAWFAEARRGLRPGGRVVLVEHMRDAANFLAFGPGFLHFHSPASWRRCWERAGLRGHDEFGLTPWLRVFVLTTT